MFEPSEEYELVESVFDFEAGDKVTVVDSKPQSPGEPLLEDAEVTDVGSGGLAGEPVFEFAGVPSGVESSQVEERLYEATEYEPQTRAAYRRTDNTEFNDNLRSVGFERQQPTGRFAPADTRPDGSVPPDRAPDGRFVSPDREPIEDIGRRSDDGLFDLF